MRIEVAGEARRAVRGGSWDNGQVFARCGSRITTYPNDRSDFKGFRVCARPPSSESLITVMPR